MVNAKDWTGQKHYFLIFIQPTIERRGGSVIWEAQCDCGKTTFVAPKDVARGNTKSCGCRERRTYDPIISSAHRVWKRYKEDGLSFDNFYRLSQEECFYCGSSPSNKHNSAKEYKAGERQRIEGDFIYNGLDRLDSSKGHTLDNVVPCCWTCNNMKSNHTMEEFKAHVKRLYERIFNTL